MPVLNQYQKSMGGTESVAIKVNFHQGYLALYHHSDIRNLSAE